MTRLGVSVPSVTRDLPEHARLAIEMIRGDDASHGLAAYVDDVSVSVRDRK